MEIWVARQPIFDSRLNVAGYELLYRSGENNSFDGSEANSATAKVINAAFYSPGGREIMYGKPVFINFPGPLLANGGAQLLPPDEVVIEILETVVPSLDLVVACHDLRSRGYRLALDDFVPSPDRAPLAAIAHFIKVDFRLTTVAQQREVIRKWRKTACLVAEKVETRDEFERARAMGFHLFQGYFFAKPVMVSTTDAPGSKLNRLQILQQLQHQELDFDAIGKLVSQDSSLSYKLLRLVNSALFSVREPIDSIRKAIILVGELALRRWLTVLLLTELATDQPSELAVNALVRGKFCELLAPEAGLGNRAEDLFLLGLFSHLDAMYNRPLDELLSGLNLRADIVETLLGQNGSTTPLAALWNAILAYEHGDWDRMAEAAATAGIPTGVVRPLYAAAVQWAELVVHGGPVEKTTGRVAGEERVNTCAAR
jgi:EAL and modified HD-GYP domain-containing signal transduction protein